MKRVKFIFGVHNHQPVGNFDHVFEDAFQRSYKPFLDVVTEFPEISLVLHFSGCLLEWLEDNHPDYLEQIRVLVSRGNVELLSGGFYEPILIMLPDRDKIGQIEKMNQYIRDRFDYEPEGIWLTERVWEAHLPGPIFRAGLKYATVDDYHFLSSGKKERELTGFFLTEEQGFPLGIFPINQKLRYAIPFHPVDETIEYLRSFATEDGKNCIVMVDDGEKFGVWPGTYELVYRQSWLRHFLQVLRENQDWIETTTFHEYFHHNPPKGRIYLTSASYFEMSEWTLPAELYERFDDFVDSLRERGELEAMKPFVKGGVWRNFLYKYDESNWMHKKMLNISERLEQLRSSGSISGDDYKSIRDHLWKGTCNCAYWHGIFGGLYLPHLRQAIYQELLLAEKQLDQIEFEGSIRIVTGDLDLDGGDEILVSNDDFTLVCAPHRGGILQELSLKRYNFNLLNTIKRYKEGYHRKVLSTQDQNGQSGRSIHEQVVSKEKDLHKFLIYDRYPRKALLDHIIAPETTLEQFYRNQHHELSTLITESYNYSLGNDGKRIILSVVGKIGDRKVELRKEIVLDRNRIQVNYGFQLRDEGSVEFLFLPELNFALLGGNVPDRYYQLKDRRYPLNTFKEIKGISRLSLVNEWDGFMVSLSSETGDGVWLFPVETVSLSEAGFERVYQSSVVLFYRDIFLKPEEPVYYSLNLVVESV